MELCDLQYRIRKIPDALQYVPAKQNTQPTCTPALLPVDAHTIALKDHSMYVQVR